MRFRLTEVGTSNSAVYELTPIPGEHFNAVTLFALMHTIPKEGEGEDLFAELVCDDCKKRMMKRAREKEG